MADGSTGISRRRFIIGAGAGVGTLALGLHYLQSRDARPAVAGKGSASPTP